MIRGLCGDLCLDNKQLVGKIYGITYIRENPSEPYVEIPPAFIITDSDGAAWTFGYEYAEHNGEYEFNVLRNDIDMDEVAKRIVYRNGQVKIFGHYGWKAFSRSRKCFL